MLVPFSGLQTEDYLVSGELKPILNSVLKIKNKKNHETHNYEVSFGKKKGHVSYHLKITTSNAC